MPHCECQCEPATLTSLSSSIKKHAGFSLAFVRGTLSVDLFDKDLKLAPPLPRKRLLNTTYANVPLYHVGIGISSSGDQMTSMPSPRFVPTTRKELPCEFAGTANIITGAADIKSDSTSA